MSSVRSSWLGLSCCVLITGLAACRGPHPLPAPEVVTERRIVHGQHGPRLLILTREQDRFEEEPEEQPATAATTGPHFEARALDRDTFIGHDRAKAKTSISDAPLETNYSLGRLERSLYDIDDFMRNEHQPPITKQSPRVIEEDRNVRVLAYLWAAKRESNDNDFHLIIGDRTGSVVFN